jgi:ring-1,2-phenylacetyl-CoA epoxidase subunit PaaE
MSPILSLRVTRIIHETKNAVSLHLQPEDGKEIQYHPGQFLTLIFNIRDKEIRRSFSLSSSPGIDKDLAVTIKRIPTGEISTYIYNHVKEGDIIKSLPPSGRFTLETDPKNRRDLFLVAAGSGITPVYSLLKSILVQEPHSRITLVYSNRNEQTAIFYNELNEFSDKYPKQFKCIHVLSDPIDKSHPYNRHLNLQLLCALIEKNLLFTKSEAEFMICGPFGFMRMAEMIIIAMGFGHEQVHKENFVILAEQEAINSIPVQEPGDKIVQVTYAGKSFDLEIPPGKTILKAALEKDIYLPYSCQGGICGTCSAICTEGSVKMTINDVLTEKELGKGWVLTCVGYPTTKKVSLNFDLNH